MFVFTENDEALLSQRMKWVCEGDFARQNSGTMNYLPTLAASAPRLSIPCSVPPSSTDSIRSSICATSWSASLATPSMRSLAEAWPDPELVPQLVALLPWGHLRVLLGQLKNREQREW
jgi:hypothetical protein